MVCFGGISRWLKTLAVRSEIFLTAAKNFLALFVIKLPYAADFQTALKR
jgi:hypothetical protein